MAKCKVEVEIEKIVHEEQIVGQEKKMVPVEKVTMVPRTKLVEVISYKISYEYIPESDSRDIIYVSDLSNNAVAVRPGGA